MPEKLAHHEPVIWALARLYMDRFVERRNADLVADIFYEIPRVIARQFLGVPHDGAEQPRHFAVAHMLKTRGRPTPEESLEISENVGRSRKIANDILDQIMA